MRKSTRPLPWIALLAIASACSTCRKPAEPSDAAYREAVTAFYTALAAMQTTQEVLARQKLDRVVEIVPEEPAGWANLGLLLLRQQEIDAAAERIARAAALAPDSGEIARLQALAAGRRGDLSRATAHWRRSLELDPGDLEAAYTLALETERQGGAENEAGAQRLLEQLLGTRENLVARIEYVRLAAKRGDAGALKKATAPLAEVSKSWSPEAQAQLKEVLAAAAGNPRAAATRVAFLKNFLLREPFYRAALAEVSTPREEVGRPLTRFLRLKNPEPQPAAPDIGLALTVGPVPDQPDPVAWVGAVHLTGEGAPLIVTAGPNGVRVPGTPALLARGIVRDPVPDAVAAADLNYDFRTDLAVAGAGGLRLLRQGSDGRFLDVTGEAKLPASVTGAPAHGVWAADVDTDGDLDLVLAPREGSPRVVRNNGDGSFAVQEPFGGASRVRGFVWADVDGEGVPDAAFLDAGGAVHVFRSLRAGAFAPPATPLAASARMVAIAAGEVTADSLFDLLLLGADGTLSHLSRRPDGRWEGPQVLARAETLSGLEPGRARLVFADLDNNGAADLLAASSGQSQVLLGSPGGLFTPLAGSLAVSAQAAADLDGDGRLDLVGRSPDGRAVRSTSKGSTAYHWQVLRTRAATATGDQRINAFGLGGEVEFRAGLHVQKQVIAAPVVHVGLGEATRAEVVRITWPNGQLQSEFDTKADTTVLATQRLKGSCPWLFAWNGREMAFVTDLIWRSPLGLRINAQATADVLMTEDWVRIRADQLAPRDGAYDLRVTAELWETHFFDLTALMAVDHPVGTEVFVDERFAVPPPRLEAIVTGPLQPVASVTDSRGGDVSDLARARDSRHVDVPGRGRYQGVAGEHYVELSLPDAAPRHGPLWLVAHGWVRPTDSSINVAMGQGAHPAPEGLSLHVADEAGRFRVARKGLGFPAGKDKTILIDLTGLVPSHGPRRLRLATNLEIYWDRLAWAVGRPDLTAAPRRLDLLSADLSFRGYSVTTQPGPSVPERPRYVLAGTMPPWRDLEGYYTRYGDVRPLLTSVDDRYVIMNAGDEIRLRFAESPPPAPGLVRTFVMAGDGWVKDGDYNTSFSRTVLPLPTHRSGRYDTAPRSLEDDPVYRRHARDFAEYHTRYVTADRVRDALRAPGAARTR
jgi:Tfp pilus assembly protein PilF